MFSQYNFNKIKSNSKIALEKLKIIIDGLENKKIPNEYPKEIIGYNNLNFMTCREQIIEKQGFALLSNNWINKLSDWIGDKKCLEVMAGTGALSYLLRERGINIIATDNFTWHKKFNYWIDIENIDCVEAIEKYGENIDFIIISWPYMDDNAYKCLMKMRQVNSNCKMIFIGEGYGGCTADELFFNNAINVSDSQFELINKNFQTWGMIHDNIKLYK